MPLQDVWDSYRVRNPIGMGLGTRLGILVSVARPHRNRAGWFGREHPTEYHPTN